MTLRVAVLVDGDNLGASRSGEVLATAARYGTVDLARVYLDAQRGGGWHEQAGFRLQHAGTGKNASDLLLAIEAMELALRGAFDHFVIATSDGDFSHLARRLRELGRPVSVVGEAKSPVALRSACSSFHELLPSSPAQCSDSRPPMPEDIGQPACTSLDDKIRKVIAANSKKGEGVPIARFGQLMQQKHHLTVNALPEGNWRNYLAARPELYDLDPRGPQAKVRFKREGFGQTTALAAE